MNTINFSGQQTANISPEIKKRLESGENFSALDKEKLIRDTADFTQKTTDEVKKENFVFRTMRNMGVKDPKKLLKSIALTVATTIGIAYLGNKLSTKTAEMGIGVDGFLKNQKWYNTLSQQITNIKDGIVKTLRKSKSIDNIIETFKNNKAKPKADMTRGYGRGFVSIFSLTPVDILRKTFKGKSQEEVTKAMEKLVGAENASSFAEKILGDIKDNRQFCSELSDAIRTHFNTGKDNGKFLDVLKGLKLGTIDGKATEDFNVFRNVLMKEPYQEAQGIGKLSPIHWINVIGKKIKGENWKGFSFSPIGDWWPTNLVNTIGRKIRGDKWQDICKGNLGDSLIKFNAVNGSLADTGIGKLVQKSITVPTESYSNFVNDKSGLGLFLCLNTIGMFNNMQDAPKGKKVATVADDVVGTIGSIAVATPLAFATTYGLATLGKTTVDAPLANILRPIGKFFHMGLGDWSKHPVAGKIAGLAGGAMRFALIMFVFSSMFRKPIQKAIHKIFGKPYNKAEEDKKKAIEEQQNAIIPELGISNKEFMEKMQANPKALETLQKNPILAQQIANDPKLILDLLDGKEVKPKKVEMSPANKSLINKLKNGTNKGLNNSELPVNNDNALKTSANLFSDRKTTETPTRQIDTATYIPSSEFNIPKDEQDKQQDMQLNLTLEKAEKALKNAEKLL